MGTDVIKLAFEAISDLLFGENRFKNLVSWGSLLIVALFAERQLEITIRFKTISNINAIENIENIISQTKDEEIVTRLRKIQKDIISSQEENNQSASFLLSPFNSRETKKAIITRYGNILTIVGAFGIWFLLMFAVSYNLRKKPKNNNVSVFDVVDIGFDIINNTFIHKTISMMIMVCITYLVYSFSFYYLGFLMSFGIVIVFSYFFSKLYKYIDHSVLFVVTAFSESIYKNSQKTKEKQATKE